MSLAMPIPAQFGAPTLRTVETYSGADTVLGFVSVFRHLASSSTGALASLGSPHFSIRTVSPAHDGRRCARGS